MLDAELLLAWAMGTDRSSVLVSWSDEVSADSVAAYEAALLRRSRGEPVAYITGRAHFYDMVLEVSPRVMVPRPETELLVEWAIGRLNAAGAGARVVDVGTGSGAVALALARSCPAAEVHATDVSETALDQARENANRLGMAGAVRWHLADLLPRGDFSFDLIVANLPYVAEDDPDVEPQVREFEPPQALFAGEDGLVQLRRLALVAPGRLCARGALGLEIGWRQGEAVLGLLRRMLPSADVQLRQDLAGHDRLAIADLADLDATGP
jgi:release factor glutamine methyltransferase